MAFNWLAAAGGAASKYSELRGEERDLELEMFKDNMKQLGESYRTAAKERTDQVAKLRKQAAELKAMGLDETRALGLMSMGDDAIAAFKERAPAIVQAARTNKDNPRTNFTINDLVTLTDPEATGLSLDEGINNIAGIYASPEDYETDTALSSSRSVRRAQESTIAGMEDAYGMDMATIRAISSGRRVYGDAPSVTVSPELYSKEALELQKLGAETDIKESEAVIKGAEAGVADILIGQKVQKNTLDMQNVAEEVRKKYQDNEDFAERVRQRNEKFNTDQKNATTKQERDELELQYREEIILTDLEYTRTRTANTGEDQSKPGVLTKRYADTFSSSWAQYVAPLEISKNLSYVSDGQGGFKPVWSGSDEAKAAYQLALDEFTQTFVKTSIAADGYSPAILAAAKQMNAEYLADVDIMAIDWDPESQKFVIKQ